MKNLWLCGLFLFASLLASGQNLIGIKKAGAEEYVRKVMKGFNLDNSSKNESFNYFKFINTSGTKTLIVFFSDENISTHTRLMCDYSEFDFILEEFNNKYKKTSKASWEYTFEDIKYLITLEEKEWYFVVNTKKK